MKQSIINFWKKIKSDDISLKQSLINLWKLINSNEIAFITTNQKVLRTSYVYIITTIISYFL